MPQEDTCADRNGVARRYQIRPPRHPRAGLSRGLAGVHRPSMARRRFGDHRNASGLASTPMPTLSDPTAATYVTISPKILYFGTPVVLLSTENDDGSANLAPISSAWALGHTVVLGLGPRRAERPQPRRQRVTRGMWRMGRRCGRTTTPRRPLRRSGVTVGLSEVCRRMAGTSRWAGVTRTRREIPAASVSSTPPPARW